MYGLVVHYEINLALFSVFNKMLQIATNKKADKLVHDFADKIGGHRKLAITGKVGKRSLVRSLEQSDTFSERDSETEVASGDASI